MFELVIVMVHENSISDVLFPQLHLFAVDCIGNGQNMHATKCLHVTGSQVVQDPLL